MSLSRRESLPFDEHIPQALLAEMQTKVELDSNAESHRVSHHRTLAPRTTPPSLVVDTSGDALMAAAVPAPKGSERNLAEIVSSLHSSNACDLDARGKGGGRGRKREVKKSH